MQAEEGFQHPGTYGSDSGIAHEIHTRTERERSIGFEGAGEVFQEVPFGVGTGVENQATGGLPSVQTPWAEVLAAFETNSITGCTVRTVSHGHVA